MSDEAQEFHPNENMLSVLTSAQSHGYRLTLDDVCKSAGVTPQSYYRWHREVPGFTAWWEAENAHYIARVMPRVHGTLLGKALGDSNKGDVAALKLALERFDKGYVPRTAQEIHGKHDVTINADAELERRMLEIAGGDTEGHSAGGGVPSGDVPEAT